MVYGVNEASGGLRQPNSYMGWTNFIGVSIKNLLIGNGKSRFLFSQVRPQLLLCSQVVRHEILALALVGSNPTATTKGESPLISFVVFKTICLIQEHNPLIQFTEIPRGLYFFIVVL